MEINIRYTNADLTSYYSGSTIYQGKEVRFNIIKIIDLETKDIIDFNINMQQKDIKHLSEKEIQLIKDDITLQFNKTKYEQIRLPISSS